MRRRGGPPGGSTMWAKSTTDWTEGSAKAAWRSAAVRAWRRRGSEGDGSGAGWRVAGGGARAPAPGPVGVDDEKEAERPRPANAPAIWTMNVTRNEPEALTRGASGGKRSDAPGAATAGGFEGTPGRRGATMKPRTRNTNALGSAQDESGGRGGARVRISMHTADLLPEKAHGRTVDFDEGEHCGAQAATDTSGNRFAHIQPLNNRTEN